MKGLLALLCLLPLLAVAQSRYKTPPKPTLKPIQLDVREIGGTNYQLHMLRAWINGSITNEHQPLIHWRELRGEVAQLYSDGVLLRRYMPPYLSGREIRADYGDGRELFFLVRYPNATNLVEGNKVKVLAMRNGSHTVTNATGGRHVVAKFDYGKPVSPATNAPAKK